jgi:hypothetical protein
MSKLNGDKARHNKQQYKKALMRQSNRLLRQSLKPAKAVSHAAKAEK